METASVFISGAAFLLAIASLYLTSLRRTKIEVDHLEDHPHFEASAWQGYMPDSLLVAPPVFVWNSGAHSGVVQTFKCTDFRCVGASLFGEMRERQPKQHQSTQAAPSHPPWPIDANDGETYFIVCIGVRADDVPDAETYARRLAQLEAIELDVSWSFRRPKLLRGRKTVVERQTITIDCDELRAIARNYWAVYRPDLIELLPPGGRVDASTSGKARR